MLAGCAQAAPELPTPTVSLGNATPAPAEPAVLAPMSALPTGGAFAHDPHEPVGPWAVFPDGDGFSVLDEVQRRIVRYGADGAQLGTVPIPSAATWDAVAKPDGYALLVWHPGEDFHWSVQDLDGAGTLRSDVRVDLDPPTAVLLDGDRVLVEDGHADTVDALSGARFPGRPTGAGDYVRAEKVDLGHVRLTWSDADGTPRRRVVLKTDRPLSNLVDVVAGPDTTVVTMLLMETTTDPVAAAPELRTVVVDRKGHLRHEWRFAAGDGHEVKRSFAVLADGSLVRLRVGEDDVEVDRVRP